MKLLKMAIAVMVLSILVAPCWGATINVPGDQPTVQGGINAATDGDSVMIAAGTYTGPGNYNIDFKGKSITIKSVNGPETCIIDCQQMGRGFLVYSGETVTLKGVTVKNGDANGKGGGIYIINSSSATIVECIFQGMNTGEGSAIYGEAIIIDSTFTDNLALAEDSIICWPNSIIGCNIKNNTGVCVKAASYATISNCNFSDNDGKALSCGWGIAHVAVSNCNFARNSNGAVLFARTITNCIFTDNNTTWKGGAIYSTGETTQINNCLFAGNTSSKGGGAIYISATEYVSPTITNCTFYNNSSTNSGGAIECNIEMESAISLSIKNCIIRGNIAPVGAQIFEANKTADIIYSNIEDGIGGLGNIDVDPLFVDVDNNDFHLQYGSPCINTGISTGAPADDLDGNYRPVGSGYDVGAYEYQGPIIIDSFTANPTTGEPPLIVTFNCSAHDDYNTITGYQWNLGDGNTDTTLAGTIQHAYIIPGTFLATCTAVNDNSDQTTVSTTIEVINDIPIADAGPNQIIPGNSVELDGSGSNDPDGTISSWEWVLEHLENSAYNRAATGETPSVSNLEYGNYTVTLTVTDNHGGIGTDAMYLCIAASNLVYTQAEYEQAQQDSYNSGYLVGHEDGYGEGYNAGYTAGQEDCEQSPIQEDAEGHKFLNGPLIIEDKGLLTIR